MVKKMKKQFIFIGIIIVIIIGSVFVFNKGTSPAQENLPPLRIVSPADGTVVAPGETFTVVVELAPGVVFSEGVGLWGSLSFTRDTLIIDPSSPFNFLATIKDDAQLGIETLFAIGLNSPGISIDSPIINIYIERPDSPTELKVTPRQIIFETGEEHSPLHVSGRFSDGVLKTINDSTLTTYTSSNPNVAVADQEGVTAVGNGTATIIIGYRDKSVDVLVSVPESVSVLPGDFNADGCVDRADYRILIADIRNGAPNDSAHDLNGDGVVNRADARTLAQLFTNPRGAPCS